MAVHTACTGEETGTFSWYSYENYHDQNMTRAKAFSVIILLLSGVEFLLCIGSLGYGAYAHKRDENKVREELIIVAFENIFILDRPVPLQASPSYSSSSWPPSALPLAPPHQRREQYLSCSKICERAQSESIRAAKAAQLDAAHGFVATLFTYDHITPVLKNLHWLPVRYRINF